MRSVLAILAGVTLALAAGAENTPLPKDVIKPREEGKIPTAVWLAECEVFFDDFLSARRQLDELVAAGGYADDPAALSNALNRQTVPAAQAVMSFCAAYVPDTKWGEQLRQEIIDAMVSSLASDAHIVEVIAGTAESRVPLAEMLAEQKEMSDSLIGEAHDRIVNAPKKYRGLPDELKPSRDYYFQNLPSGLRREG